jgi:magnesium-transporting ATPase (P-type)
MTCLLHLAPFWLGLIFGLGGMAAGECSQLSLWLLVQALLSFAHIAFSIYMFKVMQKPFDPSNPKDRNLNARVQEMLCYDLWFAGYILVGLFQFVWLILGSVWQGDATESACDQNSTIVMVVVIFSWIFLAVASTVFVCSWCCSAADEGIQHAQRDLESNRVGSAMMGNFFGTKQGSRQAPVQATPVVAGRVVNHK